MIHELSQIYRERVFLLRRPRRRENVGGGSVSKQEGKRPWKAGGNVLGNFHLRSPKKLAEEDRGEDRWFVSPRIDKFVSCFFWDESSRQIWIEDVKIFPISSIKFSMWLDRFFPPTHPVAFQLKCVTCVFTATCNGSPVGAICGNNRGWERLTGRTGRIFFSRQFQFSVSSELEKCRFTARWNIEDSFFFFSLSLSFVPSRFF